MTVLCYLLFLYFPEEPQPGSLGLKDIAVFGWGEFLIRSHRPDCKVSMDGRYETAYPERVYKEYFDFLMSRKDWESFLIAYLHDLVMIQLNTNLFSLMSQHLAGKSVYADFTSVVSVRNAGFKKAEKNKQASRKRG